LSHQPPNSGGGISSSKNIDLESMATVVLGSQWGDEGKGKLVDILCEDIEVCARSAGGNNAGHTIVANGVSYDFHILPSGQYRPIQFDMWRRLPYGPHAVLLLLFPC
jgi:hypothetical protein